MSSPGGVTAPFNIFNIKLKKVPSQTSLSFLHPRSPPPRGRQLRRSISSLYIASLFIIVISPAVYINVCSKLIKFRRLDDYLKQKLRFSAVVQFDVVCHRFAAFPKFLADLYAVSPDEVLQLRLSVCLQGFIQELT